MKERNYMYIPYDQNLSSMRENDPMSHACMHPAVTNREREKNELTMLRHLSPDHLTALYWG